MYLQYLATQEQERIQETSEETNEIKWFIYMYSWWRTPVPSLMKIHPGVLEISCSRCIKIAYLDQVH